MKAGIIGEKLGHTASPAIHEKLFRVLGISGTYDVQEIPRGQLAAGVARLKGKGYEGLNVTIPYKTDIIPLLDTVSPEAQKIGAVNTVHLTAQGLAGYNTDYGGFGRSLTGAGIDVSGKDCVVLGTGGAARAVIQCLADRNAGSIVIVSRTPRTKAEFNAFADARQAEQINYDQLRAGRHGQILVNCTPVGMYPQCDASPLPEEEVQGYEAVVDLIYNPKETRLLQYGKRAGAVTLNGMHMLVGQAIAAEEIWLGHPIEQTITAQIVREMEDYL